MAESVTVPETFLPLDLPASKSMHNRLLMLKKMHHLHLNLLNPSQTDDSLLLESLLAADSVTKDCKNAGTVLRFLTAYYASVPGSEVLLTGSERMMQRPIGPLVSGLNQLGAKISYTGTNGFPPIRISGRELQGGTLEMESDLSSQFVSALLMAAPRFSKGLRLSLKGPVSSRPYIDMTISLMQNLGFNIQQENGIIAVEPGLKIPGNTDITLEPDWSAAAFWFLIISVSGKGNILLKHLKPESFQGDAIIRQWAGMLGVKTHFDPSGLWISPSEIPVMNDTEWDLNPYPDLTPPVVLILASHKRRARFKGLHHLAVKESNRTAVLRSGLQKCGVRFEYEEVGWTLDASEFQLPDHLVFDDHNDHRMAMAFGSLNVLKACKVSHPECVVKSYPGFWQQLNLFCRTFTGTEEIVPSQ